MRTRTSRQRGRKRSRTTPAPTAASPSRPAYPRGNPLTDWVALTDNAGACWLAYVEAAPPETPLRRNAALLPGRRLRFDSLENSLVISPIPVGAPNLPESRLVGLLGQARPLPEPALTTQSGLVRVAALGSLDWGGSIGAMAGAVRDAGAGRWEATVGVLRRCARGLVHVAAAGMLRLIVVWEALLARPRARI